MKEVNFPLLFLILLLLLLFFAPRGFFKEKANFSFDEKGNQAIEVYLDPPFYQKAFSPLSILKTSFSKSDYLFLAYYQFSLEGDLNLPQSPRPLYLVLSLPGSIIKSNADRIEEGKAYWLLTGTSRKNLFLKTRYIRWWYILLSLLSLSYLSWWWLRGRKEKVVN